jgi:hypothetical protein
VRDTWPEVGGHDNGVMRWKVGDVFDGQHRCAPRRPRANPSALPECGGLDLLVVLTGQTADFRQE